MSHASTLLFATLYKMQFTLFLHQREKFIWTVNVQWYFYSIFVLRVTLGYFISKERKCHYCVLTLAILSDYFQWIQYFPVPVLGIDCNFRVTSLSLTLPWVKAKVKIVKKVKTWGEKSVISVRVISVPSPHTSWSLGPHFLHTKVCSVLPGMLPNMFHTASPGGSILNAYFIDCEGLSKC